MFAKKYLKVCLTIGAIILLPSGCRTSSQNELREAPRGDNSLQWWGLDSIRYDDLPMTATLSKVPWAGDYWATFRGGISHRWNAVVLEGTNYKDFLYEIPTAAQIAKMTDAQLDKLSPAEKFDIWQGRTDLASAGSVTGKQRQFMLASAKWNSEVLNKDEIPGWTGICNGWSLAAIFEKYPRKAVVKTLPDGRKINFYPDDMTALISQIYFDYQPAINVARLGAMCDQASPAVNRSGRLQSPACRDVNPMSFHIALGRFIAKDRPFVFDLEPATETWNQPIYGYEMELKNKRPKPVSYRNAARGTTQVVDVFVTVQYVREAMPATVGRTDAELREYLDKVDYRYTLEMDDAGMLLGGEWKKNSLVPDFLWRPEEMPTDALLKRVDPNYPISYDRVKELLSEASGV